MSEKNEDDLTSTFSKNQSFSSLEGNVSSKTLKAIKKMGFEKMTEVQVQSIPQLLHGRDLLGAAKTGSGKTLAFLIPVVELMRKHKFKAKKGTGAIIISPTRELSMQTYEVLSRLTEYHKLTIGLAIGGADRKQEVHQLEKGINILVATPGRLLDHLQNTKDFLFTNLRCLVIDEADKILQQGFENDLKKIITILPKERQTMLFSATQTQKTEGLARLSLNESPVYIGVDDHKQHATVERLLQCYIVCPPEKKFNLLFWILKKNEGHKVMVFFSSRSAVKYFTILFNCLKVPVISLHGRQKQAKREEAISQFSSATSSVLLCTNVAARGLDIPSVDLILQYDPPDDPDEYIHRVGRTARGQTGTGSALLFLLEEELIFLHFLEKAKVPISESDINWEEVVDVQSHLRELMSSYEVLKESATEAYKGYVRSYASHSRKDIFDVRKLDLVKVGFSFGLINPPHVETKITNLKRKSNSTGSFNYEGAAQKRRKIEKRQIFKKKSVNFKRGEASGNVVFTRY